MDKVESEKGFPMKTSLNVRLVRLGGRYGRASLARDYETMAQVARKLDRLAADNPEVWIEMFVVRGQNVIRRARRLEALHV